MSIPSSGRRISSPLVSVGCAYTLASTYPLGEPLKSTGPMEPSLLEYGRARHEAALILLDRLSEVRDLLLGALSGRPG